MFKLNNVWKSIGKTLKKLHLGAFIGAFFEDILIFSGLGFITLATFMLSEVAGFYCLGACLFSLGVYFTRNPIRKLN